MFQIVSADPQYFESFRKCLDEVARERTFLALEATPSIEQIRSFANSISSSNGVQLFAIDDSRVIGWIDITRSNIASIRHRGELGMGIAKEYRGRGTGNQLLQNALTDAAEHDIRRVELEVRVDNKAAIKLYERYQFAIEGTRKSALSFDGTVFDCLAMARTS